jgi:hypothetical protein
MKRVEAREEEQRRGDVGEKSSIDTTTPAWVSEGPAAARGTLVSAGSASTSSTASCPYPVTPTAQWRYALPWAHWALLQPSKQSVFVGSRRDRPKPRRVEPPRQPNSVTAAVRTTA